MKSTSGGALWSLVHCADMPKFQEKNRWHHVFHAQITSAFRRIQADHLWGLWWQSKRYRDRNRCCLSNFYRFFSWDDPYIRSLFFPSCLTPIYHVKKFFELATLVVQSVSHCPWYKYKLMFGISPARITWNWYTKYILQPIHPQDSIPGNTWASIQTVPMNWPGLGRTLEWALHAVLASMFAKPFLLLSVPLNMAWWYFPSCDPELFWRWTYIVQFDKHNKQERTWDNWSS